MLQKHYRLRRSADVKQVRQQGNSWRHPLTILLATKNDQDVSRFAVSASRGVGKAVVRNRARRLLREAVRRHLHEIENGWDCLLIARTTTPQASFAEVEAAVLRLLARARLWPRDMSSHRPE